MSVYAEITNGTITNTVACDQAFATAHGLVQIDQLSPVPGIGWTTSDGGSTWTAPVVAPTPQEQAQQAVQNLAANVPAMQQQIQADAALFANTPVGSTLTADHLAALQRVVNGFSTVLDAIQNHATFTGAIR